MLTLFKNKRQALFIRKWVPWCIIKRAPRNGCEPAGGFQRVSLLDGEDANGWYFFFHVGSRFHSCCKLLRRFPGWASRDGVTDGAVLLKPPCRRAGETLSRKKIPQALLFPSRGPSLPLSSGKIPQGGPCPATAGRWGQPTQEMRCFCHCSEGRVDAQARVSRATWHVAAWFAAGVRPSGCISPARTAFPEPASPLAGGVPPSAFSLLGLHEDFH